MNNRLSELTTQEIRIKTAERKGLIVDIRSSDAFNGWKIRNEKRGGHIPGAVNFPQTWLKYKFELTEFLLAKGIRPERSITLYGYDDKQTASMASELKHAGYDKISLYNRFVDAWSENDNLPIEFLPGYKKLVYPGWIERVMRGESSGGYEGNNFVICHAHYDNYADYELGHIPGAIALNTLDLESPDTWNCRSPKELENTLLRHGIRHDTTVILYGRFSYPKNRDPFPGKSAGQLAAMRCAMIMLYAGVKDVKLLNGSILAWEEAGFDISFKPTEPAPATSFGTTIPEHPEYIVDINQARELLKSDDGELVCVRSSDEYNGIVSGYNYIDKKGRIPGAVFGNCGSDAYHMENYRNPDLTMRAAAEVAAIWSETGIIPDKHNAFYCGTGWRGSEAFLNAFLMGWPRVSVYDGGWMEWSNDPENPVETGDPLNIAV